jgi:hypothetical protein
MMKPLVKHELERQRKTWDDNIRMEDLRWVVVAQDRFQWRTLVLPMLKIQVLLPEN